jgi:hypothetical protein
LVEGFRVIHKVPQTVGIGSPPSFRETGDKMRGRDENDTPRKKKKRTKTGFLT